MKAHKVNSHSIPSRYRYSSAYVLKSSYQRYMLMAMLSVVLLVTVPTAVIGWWPESELPDAQEPSNHQRIDTVVVDWPINRKIEIERERLPISQAVSNPSHDRTTGAFVGAVATVPDMAILDAGELVFGPAEGMEMAIGPVGLPDLGELAGILTVYIPDTTVYDSAAQLDRLPELVSMKQPVYPLMARKTGIEGQVILRVRVARDGSVEKVELLSEEPSGLGFGESALDAIGKAVFTPALYRRQPVRCLVKVPVDFVLNDEK